MSRIQVLLSTYQGERYLREQLDSVLAQDCGDLEVLVRDDGSRDGTRAILNEYANRPGVRVVVGENVGVVRSFLELLVLSSPDAAYFALCDQDDVWLTDKLSRALRLLETVPAQVPGVYASRVTVVDQDLRELHMSRSPRKPLSLANALVENVLPGCTMVLNRAARDRIVAQLPTVAFMHDWWIYQVLSAFGRVCFDEKSRILYRQHAGNAVGIAHGAVRRWHRRISRFMTREDMIARQAQEFRRLYADLLSPEQLRTVDRVVRAPHSVVSRLQLALGGSVYRQAMLDNCLLKLVILANKL